MFSFSNFTFWHSRLLSKKVEKFNMIFELVHVGKFSICLIVASWKFDVLKTSIFALDASRLGQIFVLRTSNFRRVTFQPIVPRQEHSI